MKKAILAAVLLLAFAIPAFAFEGGQPSQGPGPAFEQRKSDAVAFLNERIQSIQNAIACIQAATDHQQLKQCWEQFKAQDTAQWQQFRAQERQETQQRQGR
ncbi:MAG: hypothetical protein WCA15_12125 [Candidatus Acidiferrales bacterium]